LNDGTAKITSTHRGAVKLAARKIGSTTITIFHPDVAQVRIVKHKARNIAAIKIRPRCNENDIAVHKSKKGKKKFGGRDRDRTGDPLLAKQVLSQLSYTPSALAILLTSIPVAGAFRLTTKSPFLGTFRTTFLGNTKP
jgi:hypothetical protein